MIDSLINNNSLLLTDGGEANSFYHSLHCKFKRSVSAPKCRFSPLAPYLFWPLVGLFRKMNDLPVTGYPCHAQRILGSLGGKHCKSLERNISHKVVSSSKAVNLDKK